MSTLTSSVINKSSKKIAPKAAVQRRQVPTPASTQPSQRASVERQGQSQPSGQTQGNVGEHSAPVANSPPPTRPPASGEDRNEPVREPPRESIAVQSEQLSNEAGLETRTTTLRTDLGQVPSTSVIPSPNDPQFGAPENATDTQPSVKSTVGHLPSASADPGEPSSKRRRIEKTTVEVEVPAVVSETHTSDVPAIEASTQTAEPDIQSDQAISTPARPAQIVEVVIERNPATSTAEQPASSARQPAQAKGKRKGKGVAKNKSKDGTTTSRSSQTKTRRKQSTSTNARARNPRKRKEPDPDDETAEINPSEIKMADLCKDSGKGQTSKREKDLANMDWEAEIRKQNERQSQQERGEVPPPETVDERLERASREQEAATRVRAGIKLRLVNGEMVVDDQSLQVDRHANAAAEAAADTLEEVEENDLTRRITSGSWMKREKIETWDEELTDRFYLGLQMFGTDFMTISKMFPGRSRRQIKLKFSREERQNPDRIKDTLIGPKVPMDLALLSQLSNTEYEDPHSFHEELEREAREHAEQMKRQEEQAQEVLRQRRENAAAAASATAATTTGAVTGGNDSPEATGGRNDSSTKENVGNSNQATTTVDTNSGKRKRGGKKPAEKPRKKMFSRHGGGEELEIVGTIEG